MNHDAFLPPKLNPLVLGLVRRSLPALLRWHAGGIKVEISEADLSRLAALKGQRVMLLPNHPTHFDPLVMFQISGQLGEDFRYVACREAFDFENGARGWLFQRCGVYSLIRGAPDRDSFATTQATLVEGKHWLTIFIEGEVSLENDTLIPFEPGVLSLAMRAQETLSKSPDPALSSAPIYAVPVALRTHYNSEIEIAIGKAVIELEESVGLAAGNGFTHWQDTRERIIKIGLAVMTAVERTYRLSPGESDDLEKRLANLKDHMLSRMEAYLDLHPAAGDSLLNRIRAVHLKIDRIIYAYGEVPKTASTYELRLLEKRREAFVDFYGDMDRLLNVLTLRGGYLDHATPERFAEVVIRLQEEILGKRKLVYPRVGHVSVGQLTSLLDHLEDFRTDKRQTAAKLAGQFERDMSEMLGSKGTGNRIPRKCRESEMTNRACRFSGKWCARFRWNQGLMRLTGLGIAKPPSKSHNSKPSGSLMFPINLEKD